MSAAQQREGESGSDVGSERRVGRERYWRAGESEKLKKRGKSIEKDKKSMEKEKGRRNVKKGWRAGEVKII